MPGIRNAAAMAAAVSLSACSAPPPASGQEGGAPRSPSPSATAAPIRVETVVRGLEHPWALAFLPDGRLLVTERPGRLRIVDGSGNLSAPLGGVPKVWANGQGGLLDVAIDPEFARNRLVYLSFSEPGEGGAGTAAARGRLAERGLENVEVIYRQQPKTGHGNHFGSRLVFTQDGKLFITQGDRQDQRPLVQDLSTLIGKIVRINPDGSIPEDNPFVGRAGARPEIWSVGHRSVQAAALHPETGQLWTVEHGARGGDELNHPEAGKNYGWPVITYGIEYSGGRIGEGITTKEGMEQPVYYWDPVIAPSGMAFYTGDAFPEWKGNVLVGSMQPGGLVRLVLEGAKVVKEERYRGELGTRIRDVQQGPDGLIYLVTDAGDGRLLRVGPGR